MALVYTFFFCQDFDEGPESQKVARKRARATGGRDPRPKSDLQGNPLERNQHEHHGAHCRPRTRAHAAHALEKAHLGLALLALGGRQVH